MLGFYQSCLATFELMEEGRGYPVQARVWEQIRELIQGKRWYWNQTWARQDFCFRRQQTKLLFRGAEVFDFGATQQTGLPSMPPAFALTLTLSFTLAFSFSFTLAFALGLLDGLPAPDPERLQNLNQIRPTLEKTDFGFAGPACEGRFVGADKVLMMVGPVSEDCAAQIQALIARDVGR